MRRLAIVVALVAVPSALPSHGGLRDQAPAWSPDGQSIAFITNPGRGGEIWVTKLDGTGHRQIMASIASQPAWSPEGRRIAVTALRAGGWDIYVKDLDTGAETRVTTHESPDWNPSWSPDGSRLAFYRFDEATRRGAIVVARADGSGGEVVLATEGNNGLPTWSPDGTQIVFQSHRDGNWEIYVMRADGFDQRRLTTTPDRHEGEPAFFPDGRIVFSAGTGATRDIYVMNADGSGERRLTQLARPLWGPRVSPDGTRIAFFEFEPGRIYVANADGTGVKRLFDQLSVAAFVAAPKRAIAGRRFVLTMKVSGPSAGATTTCRATIRGSKPKLLARSFSAATARCAWMIPGSASGKRLRATVAVAAENGRVTRRYASPIR